MHCSGALLEKNVFRYISLTVTDIYKIFNTFEFHVLRAINSEIKNLMKNKGYHLRKSTLLKIRKNKKFPISW